MAPFSLKNGCFRCFPPTWTEKCRFPTFFVLSGRKTRENDRFPSFSGQKC